MNPLIALPPLWAINLGQLMIALITVVCFALILRRLNDHWKKTLQIAIDLMVKQQEVSTLMANNLGTLIKNELLSAAEANKKLDALMLERAIEPWKD